MSRLSRVTPKMHADMADRMLSLLSVDGGLYRGPLPPTGDTKTLRFRLGPPEPTGMCVTDILFLVRPDRIVITGDSHPVLGKAGGLISDSGYGVWWFARSQGDDYLAEKFLRKEYHPVIALEWLQGWVEDAEAGDHEATAEQVHTAKDVLRRATDGNEQHTFELATYDAFHRLLTDDLGFRDIEGEGWGYDPSAQGWLVAIQDRFSVLYAAMFSGTAQEQNAAVDYAFWAQHAAERGEGRSVFLSMMGSVRLCSEAFLRSLPPKAPHVADELDRRAAEVAS